MKSIAYKNFVIEVHAGKWVASALLVNGPVTEYLNSVLADFTVEFEAKNSETLLDWSGDRSKFKPTIELAKKYFS